MGEWKDGVSGATGEEGAGGLTAEDRFREGFCGPDGGAAEGGHRDRVGGKAEKRAGEIVDQGRPVADGTGEEELPSVRVLRVTGGGKLRSGGVETVLKNGGCAVVERMGERGGWFDPAKAVVGQW